MTSEVCPFCGKTFKRLKSHLPHCKAAAVSAATSTHHDAAADQAPPQLATGAAKAAAKGKKPTRTTSPNAVKSKTASAAATPVTSASAAAASHPATSPSPPSSRSTPSVKKKQKLSDQIKMADTLSSGPPAAFSEPKKKSLRALIEAAKSGQVAPASASGDLLSGSTPQSPEPGALNSKPAAARSGFKAHHPTLASADTKPKKTPRALSKTKTAASSLDLSEGSDRPGARGSSRADGGDEGERLSGSEMTRKLGSSGSSRAGITVQDVRTTLARAKTSRSSILDHIEICDLNVKTKTSAGLGPGSGPPGARKDVSGLTEPLPDLQPAVGLQQEEGMAVKLKGPVETCLIPPKNRGSLQCKPTAPAAPPLPDLLPSQVRQTTPLQHAAGMNEGMMSSPSAPPAMGRFSRPESSLPTGSDWSATRELRRENIARRGLGQVRLRELPEWLAWNTPKYPGEVVETIQKGWQWYYRRYVDVRRGGVGGVGMLVAGYCVLSYVWSYPHLKRDRWRKYH